MGNRWFKPLHGLVSVILFQCCSFKNCTSSELNVLRINTYFLLLTGLLQHCNHRIFIKWENTFVQGWKGWKDIRKYSDPKDIVSLVCQSIYSFVKQESDLTHLPVDLSILRFFVLKLYYAIDMFFFDGIASLLHFDMLVPSISKDHRNVIVYFVQPNLTKSDCRIIWT